MSDSRPSRERKAPERLVAAPLPEPKKKIKRTRKSPIAKAGTKKTATKAKGGKAGAKAGGKGKKAGAKAKKTGPKRAKTSYLFFSADMRASIKKANPSLDFADVAKALGEKWNKLPAAQRAKYEQLAAKDKARYDAEVAKLKK
ncbi:MAG: HMG-box domain-containing protein [archaeon]|nr:HMG-box domain-containing protein [archaeon]